MTRLLPALILLLALTLPGVGASRAHAQSLPFGIGAPAAPADDERIERARERELERRRDDLWRSFEQQGAPLLERRPVGIGGDAGSEILREVTQALREVGFGLRDLTRMPAVRVFRAQFYPLLALLFAALALLADVAVRRLLKRRAPWIPASWLPGRSVALRPMLARAPGELVIPIGAWSVAMLGPELLAVSPPWLPGLQQLAGVLVAYRIAVVGLELACADGFGFAAPVPLSTLRNNLKASVRALFILYAAAAMTRALGFGDAASDLVRFTSRLVLALVIVRLYTLRGTLLSMLPVEGGEQYQRFRGLLSSGLTGLLAFSVVLGGAYALGFDRLVTLLFLRSYAVAALLVGTALLFRWAESIGEDPEARPLVRSFLHRTGLLLKTFVLLGVAHGSLVLLGLADPLIALLRYPLFFLGTTAFSVMTALVTTLWLAGAVLVSRVARLLLDALVYPSRQVEEGAAYAANVALHYAILSLGAVFALVHMGLNLAALTVFAGALGVGIGIGLQDVARNIVSGFILLFGRTVKKGDLVTVSDKYFGRVNEIGARSVTVTTNDWTELVIPSSVLINNTVVNWTRSNPYIRLHVPVRVAFGSDIHAVREALLEAATRYGELAADPPPEVWLVEFAESWIAFELLVWIDGRVHARDRTVGRLLFHVWDVLRERGIEIPFPQRDLHIRTAEGLRGVLGVEATGSRVDPRDEPPRSDEA